jgi:hypothetical protein
MPIGSRGVPGAVFAGGSIDLRTNEPTPEAVRTAARKILYSSVCRDRAKELAQEFASHDIEAELLALIASLCRTSRRCPICSLNFREDICYV